MAAVLIHRARWACDIHAVFIRLTRPGLRWLSYRPGFSCGSRATLLVGSDTDVLLMSVCRGEQRDTMSQGRKGRCGRLAVLHSTRRARLVGRKVSVGKAIERMRLDETKRGVEKKDRGPNRMGCRRGWRKDAGTRERRDGRKRRWMLEISRFHFRHLAAAAPATCSRGARRVALKWPIKPPLLSQGQWVFGVGQGRVGGSWGGLAGRCRVASWGLRVAWRDN